MAVVKSLIFLQLLIVVAVSLRPIDVIKEEWKAFKQQYQKNYEEKEDFFRMKVFMENRHKIASHNQKHAQGKVTYKLAMNEFGDLLHHEFASVMNGLKRNYSRSIGSTFLTPENIVLPKEVDWRKKGLVTPIKNQGQCGSCWSFSATGSLEGQHARKTGKLVSLSEQNLVDCSTKFGNEGCNGGLMDNAFDYIKSNHGIDTEEAYPYVGVEQKCHFKRSNIGATDTGFVDIPSGKEHKLQEAVATIGPVSVAIDASHESFQFYSTGVYNEPDCSSEELDHGVLVVGYGEMDNVPYWLVKNSWGESWGEEGYVKMTRNQHNQCGIASKASYPLV